MNTRYVMGKVALALLCSLFLLVWSGGGFAAKPLPTTGTLKGKVTVNGTNTAIAGATVSASGAAGVFTVTTGSRGTYALSLPAGGYNVTASAPGYTAATLPATIMAGATSVLNFALNTTVATTGTISGTVTNGVTGAAIAGAQLSTATGGYTAVTDSAGAYLINEVTAGSYTLTASAEGYDSLALPATVQTGAVTTVDFALAAQAPAVGITSLNATPELVSEGAGTVSLDAVITGTPFSFSWSQVSGPKV
ncbi:MAG: carboxypeptidase-like regulatory domain-containing protein, partial [Thermodesulfobacteriota bacterium]